MNAVVEARPASPSLVQRFAARYQVDPSKLLATLKQTAFRTEKPASDEQMMALLLVAENYGLNPWTKEIYAFEDKFKGIVPVVGVDGWARIINEHPQFDGVEFAEADDGAWVECTIWRKDRSRPIKVREHMAECKRGTGPWQSHPRRMLRHKALIQCARLAFGFAGIHDQDEAERIIESTAQVVSVQTPAQAPAQASRTEQAKALLGGVPFQTAAAPAVPVNVIEASVTVAGGEAAPPADAPSEPAAEEAREPAPPEVIPQYDAKAAIAAIRKCKDAERLSMLWKEIRADFANTDRELPIDVEAAYNDRAEALQS